MTVKMTTSQAYDYIMGRLDELTNNVGKLETAVSVLQSRIEVGSQHKNPGNNGVTFRWVVERVFMPLAITVLTAVIVSALLK